jgi:hypothetical protein
MTKKEIAKITIRDGVWRIDAPGVKDGFVCMGDRPADRAAWFAEMEYGYNPGPPWLKSKPWPPGEWTIEKDRATYWAEVDTVELSPEAQAILLDQPEPADGEPVEGGAICIACICGLAAVVILLIAMIVGIVQSFAAMMDDNPTAATGALLAAWCGITAWFGAWSLDLGG